MFTLLLNILFVIAIIMGFLFLIYFLLNMYDFYTIQKEHSSRIIFKDKMSFCCAALLLIYMLLNDVTKLGFALFLVLLFSSFLFNFVIFSKNSMLLFSNKIIFENIEKVTIDTNHSRSKQFISIKINSNPRHFSFFLKNDDFDFLLENFKSKNIKIVKK